MDALGAFLGPPLGNVPGLGSPRGHCCAPNTTCPLLPSPTPTTGLGRKSWGSFDLLRRMASSTSKASLVPSRLKILMYSCPRHGLRLVSSISDTGFQMQQPEKDPHQGATVPLETALPLSSGLPPVPCTLSSHLPAAGRTVALRGPGTCMGSVANRLGLPWSPRRV